MVIAVKDVWRGALPPGTELLAGGGGLDRRVEWATALRTRPPAFEAVKGGEMAFVPVRSIRLLDERLDLAQVLQSFAEKGGVAVAILGEASVEAIAVADRMLLPLFRLPPGVAIAEVQETVVRFLLDQRTLLHERQQELHAQLMELALAGAGTEAIVDRLSQVTAKLALWQDAEGKARHWAGEAVDALVAAAEARFPEVRRWAENVPVVAADPPVHEFAAGRRGWARLVAPVVVRDGIGGYLSLIAPEAHLDQLARLAVSRAASACAIQLDRERAVLAARDELEGEFLDTLLAGSYSSEAAVRHRAERLGVDVEGEVAVLVARPDGDGTTRSRRDQLATAARAWAQRCAPQALTTLRQGALVVVLPVDDHGLEPRRLAADLRRTCAGAVGTEVSVGLGRTKRGIGGVRESYREAEQALGMSRRLGGDQRVAAFADLGLYRLLFAMHSHPELRAFYDDRVGALVEYDRRTGAGLMATLEAFFRCHGSPTEMAKLLHLHRNTVLYRLRRIEEVGQVRLSDPETRLGLHLCLRVGEVLAAAGS